MWILMVLIASINAVTLLSCPLNCEECWSPNGYTRCKNGYYLNQFHEYIPCQQICETCTCIRCTNGYFKTGNTGNQCKRCPDNCLSCTSSTSCTSCVAGYFGDHCQPCRSCKDEICSHDGQCIHGCKTGYFGGNCQPCRNCKKNRCLVGGRCTDGCIDRHYQGKPGCDPCPENCSRCESSSICDLCKPGFHGTSCQQRCRHNCITCTNDRNCSNCKGGYFGHVCEHECSAICRDGCNKVDGECSGCVDGYYKEGKRCKVCSNGCARCRNFNACNDCQSGYYLGQISYGINCIACGPNCSVCKTKDYCTACNEGHVNVKGQCLPCHNCADLKTSQSSYPKCLDGFWGQYCGCTCNDTCRICNKTTGECTECKGNTFGRYCELKCNRNCLQLFGHNFTCLQYNGTCTAGCTHGFTGTDCTVEIAQQTSTHVALTVGPILGGVVLMVAAVIVGFCMWRRRVDRSDLKTEGGYPSATRHPRAVNELLNPAYNVIDIDPANEYGNQTTPADINVASDDYEYAVVQKKSKRKPGQPDRTRGQDDGADNVHDVSAGHSLGGAANTDTSMGVLDWRVGSVPELSSLKPGHQTTPAGINLASADHVYAIVHKKSTRKPGQADKTSGQDTGVDNAYDAAPAEHSHGGAANTNMSMSVLDWRVGIVSEFSSPEPGHQTMPVGINVASADHVYAVVQNKSKRKPGQPNKPRSQDIGADSVYDDVGGATKTDKSMSVLDRRVGTVPEFNFPESGHQTTPTGINVASADHVYAIVQKMSTREPGQADKTRGQDTGVDNVYDVLSAEHSQDAAANTNKSMSVLDWRVGTVREFSSACASESASRVSSGH